MSIYLNHDSWWVDFRLYGTRIRKRSPLNTEEGARLFEATLRERVARGLPLQVKLGPGESRFSVFSQRWYSSYVRANNRPSDQRTKAHILRGHLLPAFGELFLHEITSELIENYKLRKRQAGFAQNSINNHLTVLSGCLRRAVEWGELERLPWIRRLRLDPVERPWLTATQADRLVDHADDPVTRALIITALDTGMRLGELRALRASDVTLTRPASASVERSLVEGHLLGPKNHRARRIPLSDRVVRVLRPLVKKGGFVFGQGGTPLTMHAARHRLAKACGRAYLPEVGWHALRHTFGSTLLERGVPVQVVRDLLGHCTLAMTNLYAHSSPEHHRRAIAVLGGQGASSP